MIILKEEVKSTIIVKRNKIKEAFDLIRVSLKDLTDKTLPLNSEDEYKETAFIGSSDESVINMEIFSKLMELINPKKGPDQIKVIFEVLDTDNNNLLSNLIEIKILFNLKLN